MGPSDHMTHKTRALPGCRHIRATLTLDLKTDKELDMGRRGQMWATFRSGDGFQMIGSRETRLPTDLWQQPVGEGHKQMSPRASRMGYGCLHLGYSQDIWETQVILSYTGHGGNEALLFESLVL